LHYFFKDHKRTAKFTPSLRDEEGVHFVQKFDEMKHVTPFTASCYPRG
jgi:hypothetical protein